MNKLKPIETEYDGYKFRSRLEARWAVFFDSLGVEYEYEPEGFELPSGLRYLPDFRVKCYGTRGTRDEDPFDLWIEVKGKMTELDASKIREFSGYRDDACYGLLDNPILVVGNIPKEQCWKESWGVHAYEKMDGFEIFPFNYELIDGDCFAAYPAAHDGHFYLFGDDSNYFNLDDCPIVESAYSRARKARFEHGCKG